MNSAGNYIGKKFGAPAVDLPGAKASHLDVPLQGKQIPKLDPANVRLSSRPDLHLKASPADTTLAKLKTYPTVSVDVPKVKQVSGDSATKAIGGVKPSDVDVPKVKDIHSSGNASFPKPTFQPSSGNSSVVSRVEFENNSVPSVGKAQNANLQFNSEQKLVNHFDKHSTEVAHVLKRTDYSIEQYLKDANFVVETGTYVPELNAYVKFIKYEGKNTLYAFVGLDRNTGNITTYHVKTVDYLIKKAPSLGFER